MSINKKILILGVTAMLSTSAFAGMDNIISKVKRDGLSYAVPCVSAIAVSAILVDKDSIGIGLAACAATSTLNYFRIQDRNSQEIKYVNIQEQTKKELIASYKAEIEKDGKDEMVAEMKAAVYKDVNESLSKDKEFISKMLSGLNAEFVEYKHTIDQVLAIKLVEIKGQVPKEIESALLNGPFLKILEEKMNQSMKEKYNETFDARKEEIVKKCVSDALDEIVVKQVGVKER